MNFDWNELAFGSKKPINELKATFIMAPRELSPARFKQLLKLYLPKGNIVLGLAKEPYILGFDNQPQFKTLQLDAIRPIIDKVNASSPAKIATLSYSQRDAKYLLEKLDFPRVVLVRGSWEYAFHNRPEYYILTNRRIEHDFVSPFADEAEAKAYAGSILPPEPPLEGKFTEAAMISLADNVAKRSFDYSKQTGVSLGRKTGNQYAALATAFNRVVPYQTYAMHYGAAREVNFTPPNDLNHYDTNHAEVELLIKAQREGVDLRGTTFFINLLPCPTCARMLSATDITELVYAEDHSAGYAIKILEASGKTVRRLVG